MYHDVDTLFTISVVVNFVFFMALMLAVYTNGQLNRKYDRLLTENRKLRREVRNAAKYKDAKSYRKNRI